MTEGEEMMRRSGAIVLLAGLPALAACSGEATAPVAPSGNAAAETAVPAAAAGRDIHSFGRPDQVRVTHMNLDWKVDFDQRLLDAVVTLSVERAEGASAEPLRLDSRDLDIRKVSAARATDDPDAPPRFAETKWRAGAGDPILGTELIVELPEGADLVRLEYRTSPEANGLQWLTPEQTAGKKHPFVYSQGESILTRSFLPCQDSPAVRVTYTARLRVPGPLRAVMAAEAKQSAAQEFRFAMAHPIPSYLIAWAAGDLAFGEDGPRSGVWTEPSQLERSVREFSDMEKMIQSAEATYGPYRWKRYDLLVLPPSFPFGGMENPMLTFLTPTVLAGDKSLVAVVAHELAHSWSGNLVTNATWADFWLNEGFTTYIEKRIMEDVFGKDRAEMEWMLARQELDVELKNLADKPGDQRLRVDLKGRDPDDGFTSIPYDKGSLLLRAIEEAYGREAFDTFLRAWFDEHAFQSVTTDQFVAFIEARLLKDHSPLPGHSKPDLAAWIDQPGLPAGVPVFHSDALTMVDEQAKKFAGGAIHARQIDTKGWVFHQWRHLISSLPDTLTPAQMKELDEAFKFTDAGNSEIVEAWLLLALQRGYEPAYGRLERFLTSQGRRKFLTPLYKEMAKTEAGMIRARKIYAVARPTYQASARRPLDEILQESQPK